MKKKTLPFPRIQWFGKRLSIFSGLIPVFVDF